MKSPKEYPKLKTSKKAPREEGWYNHPAVQITLKVGKVLFRCLLTMALIFVITGCIVGCTLAVYISTKVDISSDVPELTTSSTASTSKMMIQNSRTGEWEEFMHL